MARLKWNEPTDRRYETGVSKGVLYPMVGPAYPRGVAWNGLTGVTESPSGGEITPVYADDVKYLELRGAENFGGTIEAYTYPIEFARCDGKAELIPGVNFGQQKRTPFGLSFRTKVGNEPMGDDYGYKIHLIYNATVAPSEVSYATMSDSPEAITFSWEMATTPHIIDSFKPTSFIVIDSTRCLPDKLRLLEEALYGTDETDPWLPTPVQVLDMIGGHASCFYISRPDGHVKYDGPSNVEVDFTFFIDQSTGHLMCYEPANASERFDQYLENGHLFIQEALNGA